MKNKGKIGAYNEYGKLHEVIVGKVEDDAVMFGWYDGMSFIDKKFWLVMQKCGGVRFSEAEPELFKIVKGQMNNLAKLLEAEGIIVHRPAPLKPEEKTYLADLQKGYGIYFAQDPVLVIGNNVIESSLRFPVRRKERYALRPIVSELVTNNSEVKYVAMPAASPHLPQALDEPDIFLEGGDIQFDGYDVYVGCSGIASSEAGIQWLQDFLGSPYRVHTIRLRRDIMHLDGGFGLVGPGQGIMCREFIEGELPEPLKEYEWIYITEEEGFSLAGNVICLDEKRIVIDAQHQRVISELKKIGKKVITIPYAETATYGGSVHCTTNCLRRDPS